MRQASFQIGNSLSKEKNNVSKYITNVTNKVNVSNEVSFPKKVNIEKYINKNTIINDTKTHNKPPVKIVENIYYFLDAL
jgi:hypothetical protein